MNPPWIIINHWVHLFAAAAAVGGTLFMRVAVHPTVLKTLSGDTRVAFERLIRRKSAAIIHPAFLFLLITGFINFAVRFGQHPGATYTMVFLAKFLLAMAIFGIGIALIIPSDALVKFQARRPFWLTVNIFLSLIVVLLSSWLRNMNITGG